ncbi:MAG: hypothetical protein HN742_12645 [Lentisphaerae bacterium]|nr:hypothetical protein [Lentisphaerota bacterium]MBT5607125.1 hypothetical protein [Lentisphaerota bacterium]MBT7053527.1 hypothetical protein [Lentisphaerota bacterium]MBT7842717.1 hypothetical protein [Lentisphaerota bacterium]
MRYLRLVSMGVLLAVTSGSTAAPIDGSSAGRWEPQPGWSPGKAATEYAVRDREGWLEFSVRGPGKVMTWTLTPTPQELEDEPRYLVVTCRTEGVIDGGDGYLLMGRDGSPGWRCYLNSRDLQGATGHRYAVDLLSYSPPEPLNRLVLRIGQPAGAAGFGRLLVRIGFANGAPAGAEVVAEVPPEPQRLRIDPESIAWTPSPNWTPRPPESHAMTPTETTVHFSMTGQQKSMRWSARVPEGLDGGAMPYVSMRYRARGEFGPWGYAFYVSLSQVDGTKKSVYIAEPGNVEGDGQWHVFHRKLGDKGTGMTMAVGIDSLSPEAELEVDYVEFSSTPPETPVSELLEFALRESAWAPGEGQLSPLRTSVVGAPRNHFMVQRMGIGEWFESSHISVGGIPFDVAASPTELLSTGTVGEDTLTLELPEGTREVLVLLAASFPEAEPFGSSWKRPTPLKLLSEPERVTFELVYADGRSDHMLPVHASKGAYGVGHGIALYSVRPTPGREPVRLVLHDNMRNACFGILGATANGGAPRVPSPTVQPIWYPPVSKPALADATFAFDTRQGLRWAEVVSPMLPEGVRISQADVFRIELADGQTIPSSAWTVGEVTDADGGTRVALGWARGDAALEAVFRTSDEGRNGVRLSLEVSNVGQQPVTGTLFFPTAAGMRIGSVEDTWYFAARRGGVVNRVPCSWRDEIGEAHPLQVDGFFNPGHGAGLAFMPRDLRSVFRWYQVTKDAAGCSYALEFLPETVAPGKAWQSVPVVAAVIPGDWKDQLKVYLDWVKTWYTPVAPRKPWFQDVYSFGPGSPTSIMHRSLAERTDFVEKATRIHNAIGACDYMHLFGWAKTKTYGHWGDYDHYEAVGGLTHFAGEVKRCQESGTPVGLYLDGYLVHTKSQKPLPEQREAWAVRTAKGEMLYHKSYDAHSMCPYVAAWRNYLTDAFKRVAAEVKAMGMYIDEFGKCMTSRTCYATDHGHPVPMGMSPGERLLTRQIREALRPEIATYAEYVPADVASQEMDGAFGHVALDGWRKGYDSVAPHYVNLQRFAVPDFKTFELIYYVPMRNGNWFLLKYPFFNGTGYYLTGSCLQADEHAAAFWKTAYRVLHAHRDAFRSSDVEPLVRTAIPNLFANRFSTQSKNVWTLFNANYRTVRGAILRVRHPAKAAYMDAWNERPVAHQVRDGEATITLEIGPRAVGCVVQAF